MNRFTPGFYFLTFIIVLSFVIPSTPIFSQEKKTESKDLPQEENYKEQIKRLIGFLEFSLNTLGDPETSTREKEIIINESFIKAFLSDKVQVEDDLDENREILTYKDVQAYLKDVDFFFKKAEFNFEIQDIQSLTNSEGMVYFKVTANRNLKGETVEDVQVSNNKTRYIEINLDDEEQVLKIASIYTTRLNEAEELMAWWNGMPQSWKNILGYEYILQDSIRLSQVDLLNDSTLLLVSIQPMIVEHETFVYIGSDSLLIMKQDTVLTEAYDTIPSEKGAGFRALRKIIKLEDLDVAGDMNITDLYPLDQLSELKTLDASHTMVTDLYPVRSLTRLVILRLSGTGIENLDPIRYNTKIRDLYIDSTLVNTLEPVSGFEALEILHLSGSHVGDITPVRSLGILKEIKLDHTPVSDLSPLSDLTVLETVSFSGTQASGLEALQYMASLKRISFKSTSISDLTPLSRLEGLQVVDADQSQISDLTPLGDIPALEKIYCDKTGITRTRANEFMAAHPNVLVIYESQGLNDWWNNLNLDWQQVFRGYITLDTKPTKEQLHQVTLISKLDIRANNNITTLEPLAMMTNLKEILASGTYISDLEPLAELGDLSRLTFAGTRVTSVAPLASLIRLEEIDASDTPLDSLGGMENMKNLRILTIDRTAVGNLDPLAANSEIKMVYCDNTKVGKADIDRFLDRHPGCMVIYQTSLLKSWWGGLSPDWQTAFRAHTQVDDPPEREQLHAVAGLESLDLSGKREITSLEPLSMLSRLEDLNAANCTLGDISPVRTLVRLKKINLSGNPLSDLSALSSLPALRILDISNTPVEKLDALKNLALLEQLNCSGTQIKKLDPVAFLFGLKKLECQNTGINNLKPLTGLTNLKNLACFNTNLNEKKVGAFKELMPGVEVVYY